jgi:hypothetical protein
MDLLLAFMLPAVLFLTLEVFWCRPAWLRESADAGRGRDLPGSAQRMPDWDPLALPFVQHRLDVLAAELEHLDTDPSIFALGFRTHVVQAAYRDLLSDAARLANLHRLAAVSALSEVTIVEVEMATASASLQEELEI